MTVQQDVLGDSALQRELEICTLRGNSDAVLLVHGLSGAPDEMRYLAKKLSDEGYDIYAPLLAGHGQGYKELIATGWTDWLQSLKQAYDRLAGHYQRIHIAGICAGGELGLMLATDRPIATSVIYSPAFQFDGFAMRRFYSWLLPYTWRLTALPVIRNYLVQEVFPFGLKDERLRLLAEKNQGALIKGALEAMPLSTLGEMYHLGQQLLKAAPELDVPVLILHAEEDDMGDKRNAYLLQKAVGKNARVEILNNSYHMLHVDQERSKVAKLTLEAFEASRSDAANDQAGIAAAETECVA